MIQHKGKYREEAEALIRAAEMDPSLSVLDLHGSCRDEAVRNLDFFLDQGVCQGIPVVRIIHGKGTGTLRETVIRFLASHPSVVAFRGSDRPDELGAVVYVVLHA
ncbi:MAG TPA: Smr/MutS family protein [Patescibacteria group bacterium]|nr:Smr/MutS family protein [Patescibacteria group bacterium]